MRRYIDQVDPAPDPRPWQMASRRPRQPWVIWGVEVAPCDCPIHKADVIVTTIGLAAIAIGFALALLLAVTLAGLATGAI